MDAADHTSLQALLRRIPAVDSLLNQPAIANLLDEFPRCELLRCIRAVVQQRRREILAGRQPSLEVPQIALDVRRELYRRQLPSLRRVINATGIVLHTGLGRAPLAPEALEAINDVAAGYCNLEIDLPSGTRGQRHDHLRPLLRELTGAADALVVNNNAAATFLVLNTLAAARRVVVSRGQLVEIGGSYRMPEIMAAAGCRMVEVGATNRTHLADYERAIDDETAALLHVHTSNYRIEGFATAPSVGQLAELARKYSSHEIVVIDDLGSGLLDHFAPPPGREQEQTLWPQSWEEPAVRDSLRAGSHLVLFSGDKLLGGPQAGIIVGDQRLIAQLRRNPLARTFRPGKLTLAALEATLRLYRDPESLFDRLPVLRMLTTPVAQLDALARQLADALAERLPQADICCQRDDSYAGGGTLPTLPFETRVVSLRLPECPPERLAAQLRQRELPIITRVRDEALVFDCRTLSEKDIEQIPPAVDEALEDLSAD